MVRKTIATYKIEYLQVIDDKGRIDSSIMPKISNKEVLEIYKEMLLARQLDIKMLAMQKQGRIATFASVQGEEGVQVAAMHCLKKEDWVIPAFRELPALLARGLPMINALLYAGGFEKGSAVKGVQRELPTAIPIASQLCHAVGIAHGMTIKNKKTVAIVFFGDGATSEGDFHESLNWAGIFNVPCIFMCQNNQYAISTPVTKQTKSKTIAQKAIAYGIPGIKIDGNDIFSVLVAVKEAVKRARNGLGPTLIECFTYRLENHTTSDDSTRYRSKKEVEEWRKKGPIVRLRKYILQKKILDEIREKKIIDEINNKIEKTILAYEKTPPPKCKEMFEFTYKEMTKNLQEQLKNCRRDNDE